jgi:hypothetical protein
VLVIEIRDEEEQAVSEGNDFRIIRGLRNILRTEDGEYFGTVLHFLLLKAYIWRIYALDRRLCYIDVISFYTPAAAKQFAWESARSISRE